MKNFRKEYATDSSMRITITVSIKICQFVGVDGIICAGISDIWFEIILKSIIHNQKSNFIQGEVTEWLKVAVLKTAVPAMVPRVRISPSPPI